MIIALELGCVASSFPEACPEGAPCALPDGVEGTVAIATVFDRPLFELWWSGTDARIHHSVSTSPTVWPEDDNAGILGDHPVVSWSAGSWRLCRRAGGEVRCATSDDGRAWRDTEAVWALDGAVHARWPVALLDQDGWPTLFVAGERDQRPGVWQGRFDGGEAFVLDAEALWWGAEAEPVVSGFANGAGFILDVVDGDDVTRLSSADGETWSSEPGPSSLAGATATAAAVWFDAPWHWRAP